MRRHVKEMLTLPGEIREAFLQDAVHKNRIVVLVICLMIILLEAFNLLRVTALSRAGLTTVNNRIYFFLYLVMLCAALGMAILSRLLWQRLRVLNRVHQAAIPLLLAWSVLLNGYDLLSGHTMDLTIVTTVLLGVAVLIQEEPRWSIAQCVGAYGVFLWLTWERVDDGQILNLTVALLVSLLISVLHFRYAVLSIQQAGEITRVNRELLEEREKLRMSLEQHRILMDQASDIMFRWDLKRDRVEFSRNWTQLMGYPQEIDDFRAWLRGNQTHSQAAERILGWMKDYEEGKREGDHEISLQTRQGEVRWYQVRITIQRDREGQPVQGLGVLRDISALQSEIDRLHRRLQRDALTGILNQRALEDYTRHKQEELAQGQVITMLAIDLDNFKGINDTYGHPCGDHVLREMARGLTRVFRKEDGVARVGGDEFAAVLPGLEAGPVEDRVAQLMDYVHRIRWQGRTLGVSCSVGAVTRVEPVSFQDLYHDADEALYRAKQRGKDRLYILSREQEPAP